MRHQKRVILGAFKGPHKRSVSYREKYWFTCLSSDFSKAYDSVDSLLLGKVLERYGVLPIMLPIMRQFHDIMRAPVRTDDGEYSECFNVGQDLRQRCVPAPLLSSISFTAIPTVALETFRDGPDISGDLVRVRKREYGELQQEFAVAWDGPDVATTPAVEEVRSL